MREENLRRMSAEELAEYARVLGIDVSGCKRADTRRERIERARRKSVVIRVAGMDLEVEKRRVYDKRVSDGMALVEKGEADDEKCMEVLNLLLGDEQMEEVAEACTDDDGMCDAAALAYVFAKVALSPELKK